MKEMKTYFGISFPFDFCLKEEECRKLAKLLFMSPSTSALDAERTISNPKLSSIIEPLFEDLIIEMERINSLTTSDENESAYTSGIEDEDDGNIDFNSPTNFWKIIYEKLSDWGQVFSLPTEEEIIEVSKELQVPGTGKLIQQLKKAKISQLDTPVKIAEHIAQFVVGQTESIRNISVLVHDHIISRNSAIALPQTSSLIIGSTGTGKSYLVSKAREILDAPMLRVNCGDLVPAGIVGYTLTKAMTYLHLKAGSEIKKTAQGLLHFDEFDKLAIHNHINDDQWKTTTQFEMLKFFDLNEKIIFPCSFEQFARPVQMSTNNLMLVFSGAFQGLDAIIYSRLITEFDGNTKLIDKDNLMLYCTGDDIQKYGIIPELAGRLTFISPLNKLTSTDIYSILTRAKESEFSKHVKKCELMGVRIRFTENALRCIAQKVADQNLGARYINTIMTQILKDVYFNVHNYRKGELWIDDKRVLHACNSNRNLMLFREFDNNTDLAAIAEKFDIKVDNLLDIYLEYKSLKNGGQNNVI